MRGSGSALIERETERARQHLEQRLDHPHGAKARPPADKQIGTSYSNRVCYNLLQWQQKTDLAGNGAKRNEKQREMKTAVPEQYKLEH